MYHKYQVHVFTGEGSTHEEALANLRADVQGRRQHYEAELQAAQANMLQLRDIESEVARLGR